MKKHSRTLLGSLLLLLCGSSLRAQTAQPCVVVEQTDGTLTEYLLASAPRITYAADVVTLTATSATLQLPVAEVKKVYLSETESGTGGISVQGRPAAPRVQLTADGLRLSGLAAGSPVMVYAADGRLLVSQNAAADGTLLLSLGRRAYSLSKPTTSHSNSQENEKDPYPDSSPAADRRHRHGPDRQRA